MQLLESLASVLQLDTDERTHLFFLALNQPPPVETFSPMTINPTVQQFLQQLGTTPACVVDARLNVLEWNAAFCAVFGDFAMMSERERNMIWRLFTPPLARKESEEWEKLARVFLAQFRAGYGCFVNDPWWGTQIAELSRISPAFRELWAHHDVRNRPEG